MLYNDNDSFCIQNKPIHLQSLVFVVVSTFYSIPFSRVLKQVFIVKFDVLNLMCILSVTLSSDRSICHNAVCPPNMIWAINLPLWKLASILWIFLSMCCAALYKSPKVRFYCCHLSYHLVLSVKHVTFLRYPDLFCRCYTKMILNIIKSGLLAVRVMRHV
jgi:hypothetical protein